MSRATEASGPSDESSRATTPGAQQWIRLGTTARSVDQPPNAYLPLAEEPNACRLPSHRIRARLGPREAWEEEGEGRGGEGRTRRLTGVGRARLSQRLRLRWLREEKRSTREEGGEGRGSLFFLGEAKRGEGEGEMTSDWICLGWERKRREGTTRRGAFQPVSKGRQHNGKFYQFITRTRTRLGWGRGTPLPSAFAACSTASGADKNGVAKFSNAPRVFFFTTMSHEFLKQKAMSHEF